MIVKPPRLRTFSPSASAARLCAALFVVLSTYNPTGVSYLHWLRDRWPEDWTLLLPVALVYGFVYYMLVQTTFRALHSVGIVLVIAVTGSIVWLLIDLHLLVLAGAADVGTVLLYMFGAVLAVGMSWTQVLTLLTGQVTVDSIDRA